MGEKDYTTVRIKKSSLKIIRRYCDIFRFSASEFFEVMAKAIEKKVPNLDKRKMLELRELTEKQVHVDVVMQPEKGDKQT